MNSELNITFYATSADDLRPKVIEPKVALFELTLKAKGATTQKHTWLYSPENYSLSAYAIAHDIATNVIPEIERFRPTDTPQLNVYFLKRDKLAHRSPQELLMAMTQTPEEKITSMRAKELEGTQHSYTVLQRQLPAAVMTLNINENGTFAINNSKQKIIKPAASIKGKSEFDKYDIAVQELIIKQIKSVDVSTIQEDIIDALVHPELEAQYQQEHKQKSIAQIKKLLLEIGFNDFNPSRLFEHKKEFISDIVHYLTIKNQTQNTFGLFSSGSATHLIADLEALDALTKYLDSDSETLPERLPEGTSKQLASLVQIAKELEVIPQDTLRDSNSGTPTLPQL